MLNFSVKSAPENVYSLEPIYLVNISQDPRCGRREVQPIDHYGGISSYKKNGNTFLFF